MLRLGYDIGGMSVRACLVDDRDKSIVVQSSNPFPAGRGTDALIDMMTDMADKISAPFGITRESQLSVGVGIAGTVRGDTGELVSACNLHIKNMPIARILSERFPFATVAVANDADAAALAEYHAGAFRGYDSALLITIGTGIGGGLIVDDRVFQGGLRVGCELGHITLQHNGPMCACGNRGCAETLCSATWLERQGRRCVIDYPTSRVATLAKGHIESVSAKDVLTAAQEGDGVAVQIFREYVENLSSLITTCCYLLGPRVVGLGGGVSNAGRFLLEPLTDRVRERSRSYVPEKIVVAELGDTAGMIGAAMLPITVKTNIFNQTRGEA